MLRGHTERPETVSVWGMTQLEPPEQARTGAWSRDEISKESHTSDMLEVVG